MDLDDLPTPALVLDRGVLTANIARMNERMRRLGVPLRPHLKTAKSADVARLAVAGHPGGVTVSTLHEADYFLERGFADITYAVGITPARLDRAASLRRRGADLKIITDDIGVAGAIAAHGASFAVLIEIDTGGARGGVAPGGDELLEIARRLDGAPAVTLGGVLTHAGHSYDCRDEAAMAAVAEEERAGAVMAAERLRAMGLACPVVSVGSTPTATFARDLTGVTEARPGVYMFCDLFQAGIGVCAPGDIALGVLASVIGQRRSENLLLIDAGALALSKDRSTARLAEDCGFGLVRDAVTGLPHDGLPDDGLPDDALKVASVHQEHGIIGCRSPIPFDSFPVGARVRVLPNHACMTGAAHDAYHVIDGGTEIIARWPRCNGW
ncbi:MAG: alanine racemase [Proteobacteria bacterium]|nr:alanine racemase [Pseudomonadota bacterium]